MKVNFIKCYPISNYFSQLQFYYFIWVKKYKVLKNNNEKIKMKNILFFIYFIQMLLDMRFFFHNIYFNECWILEVVLTNHKAYVITSLIYILKDKHYNIWGMTHVITKMIFTIFRKNKLVHLNIHYSFH